jgi:hypothetical protein
MSDEESSDEDYDFHANDNDVHGEDVEARYPIHDCCEFEDVDTLKVRSCFRAAAEDAQLTMACTSVRQA